jgi:hypothetical protein
MKCNQTQDYIDTSQWEDWDNLAWDGREWHASCPALPAGGRSGHNHDRIVISDNNLIWCRACGAGGAIRDTEEPAPDGGYVAKPKAALRVLRPLPAASMVYSCHRALDTYGDRDYFYGREITDDLIDLHQLGYHPLSRRYSIPHWYQGVLYGIQYRSSKSREDWLRSKGATDDDIRNQRFTSELGSQCNDVLFNDIGIKGMPYCLIVESRLDALSLTAMGFPACVANRDFPELRAIPEKIIIPDNDTGAGDTIALRRLDAIKGSRIHRLPAGVKDCGVLIKESEVPSTGIYSWLGLPPI